MGRSKRERIRAVVAQAVGCSDVRRRCRAETQGTGWGSRLWGGLGEGVVTENGEGFLFIKHLGN